MKEEKLLANLLGRTRGIDNAIALDFNFAEDEVDLDIGKGKEEESEKKVQEVGVSKVILPDDFETGTEETKPNDCDLLQLMDSVWN